MVGIVNAQDNEKSFEQSIKKGKSDKIKTLINVVGGHLVIEGNDQELANVKFKYSDTDWDPIVSYTESDNLGKLIVKAQTNNEETVVNDKNVCRITLNKSLDYSMGVVLGAGKADIDLNGYHINRALFRFGVGSFNVNLANTNIPLLKIEAGIGEADIDLSGNRSQNLKAEVNAGIGEVTFKVPANVGVRFIVSGFLGEVQAQGFTKNGKEYTNSAYGKSKIAMEFEVSGAIGSINIEEK